MSKPKTPIEERFWPKVDVGDEDECWEWKAATKKTGYGVIGKGGRDEGNVHAHRLSYELEYESPGEKQVNHHCDNPACVNPKHLYAGNQSENVMDAIEHGDKRVGEEHPTAKLSSDEIKEIRRKASEGIVHKRIAKEYKVTRRHITKVVNRKRRFKHD